MRKLAIFSAAFAAAATLFVYLLRDARAIWIAGACLALSPIALKFGLRRWCAVFLGFSVGLIWCFGFQQIWLQPANALCGAEQELTVTLLDAPEGYRYGSHCFVELEVDGRTYEAVLYTREPLPELSAGDHLTGRMQAKPSGMDVQSGESLYYRSSGAVLYLYLKSKPVVEPGSPTVPMRIRLWLQRRLHTLYEGDAAGLIQALLTGDRSELSYSLQNEMSVSGISHAVAVSGMHVAYLLTMISVLCGYNPRLTALIGIPTIILFVLMTGASPSACRAAVMHGTMLLAPLVRRSNDPITTLAAAALVLLLGNPWSIASVSFQLSFAAVAGLIAFSGPIQRRVNGWKKKPKRLLRFVASAIGPSIASSIMTLPLVVYYFGLISISAVLTNLLVLWAVNVVFVFGLISCVLGSVGTWVAIPVSWLANYILAVCRWIAGFPYAAAYDRPLMIWAALAYCAVFWLMTTKRKAVFPVLGVMTAAFLACLLWGRVSMTGGEMTYRVLDVGQGQCTLLESNGFTAVIDCGGSYPEEAGELAARTLHAAGMTHVDAIILTHYDSDHAGGVMQLLQRVKAGVLLIPDTEDKSGMRLAIEQAAEAAGCPVTAVSNLTELCFSGGKLTVYPPFSEENDHNNGCCVLATAAEYDILVTGDLDQFQEMRLLSRWKLPPVELLIAGHHGAETSTSDVLLEAVQPDTVAISVDAGNSYGHPAQETLDRISRSGADVYRTDKDGTLVFQLN